MLSELGSRLSFTSVSLCRFKHNVMSNPTTVSEDILLRVNLKCTKRHATFFPSKLDLAADFRRQAMEEEDDLSTWEFHAPVEPFIKRRPRITANAVMSPAQNLARNYRVASSMSEAQQIAHRYRTGLKVYDVESTASTSTSRSSSAEPPTLVGSERESWISSGVDEITLETNHQWGSPVKEPKLRHSDSRADALAQAVSISSNDCPENSLSFSDPLSVLKLSRRSSSPLLQVLSYALANTAGQLYSMLMLSPFTFLSMISEILSAWNWFYRTIQR